MESSNLTFRNYERGDAESCVDITQSTWPVPDWVAVKEDKKKMISNYVKASLDVSNWAEVACESGKVVGFLFGEIKPNPKKTHTLASMLTGLRWLLQQNQMKEMGGFGMEILMILKWIWTEFMVALKMPNTDSSIQLFIVGPEHRGKGAGKSLFERFIADARVHGAKSLSVYTEDTGSNWRFYEKHGFRKVATFRDTGSSFYYRKNVIGIIYVLAL